MKLKNLFFTLILFHSVFGFSQVKLSYIHDIKERHTVQTIEKANFKTFKNPINNGLNNGVYWFKITSENKDLPFVLQIPNYHIVNVIAYQKNTILLKEQLERFATFKIVKSGTVYLKVRAKKEALIPIEVTSSPEFQYSEKKSVLFIGFYYGFAFIVVLINIFYFINFKENTFLHYALFLLTISFGLLISDGILHFFQLPQKSIDVLQVIDHCLVSIFSILFAFSYLQVDEYYRKPKYISYGFLILVIAFGFIYLFTNNFLFYVLMESLVFITFIFLWSLGVSLLKQNIFTKIFVFAYFFILVLGIFFYVTKLYGLPKIAASQLKIGGFLEMILLSFAVIYRMKILQEENSKMRNEIKKYATKISLLSKELKKSNTDTSNHISNLNLSDREQEIIDLLVLEKSNKEIATTLFISVNTVKYHIKKIYSKLEINNRKELQEIVSAN